MKRLGLALATFLIWGSIASIYYVCMVRGLCKSSQQGISIYPKINKIVSTTETKKDSITSIGIINQETNSSDVDSIKENTLSKKELATASKSIDSIFEKGLTIKYQDRLIKSYPLNFRIYKENSLVRIPLGLRNYGEMLRTIMLENNASLTVIGYYNDFEKLDVGLIRAKQIQKLLFSASFPKNHVYIKAKKANFSFKSYVFKGGIDFEFTPTDSIIRFEPKN